MAPTARQTPHVKCEFPNVPECLNAFEGGGTAALDGFGNPPTSAQAAKIDWNTLVPAGGAGVSCDLAWISSADDSFHVVFLVKSTCL